jgi:hypothetical protein
MIGRLMQAKPPDGTASHERTPKGENRKCESPPRYTIRNLDGKAIRRQACAQCHVD